MLLSILKTIAFYPFLINCLPPSDLALFLEIPSILPSGPVSLFPYVICFFVSIIHSGEHCSDSQSWWSAHCRGCPVGFSGIAALIFQSECCRNVPGAGDEGSPVVIGFWVLLSH